MTSQDNVININDIWKYCNSDFIDHLPKHFASPHWASHHAWAPGPHHLNLALAGPESAFDVTILPTHPSHLCCHERAEWGWLNWLCPRARETLGTPLFCCHVMVRLQFTHILSFACRGSLWNVRANCFTVGLYCVTVTWQQIFKSSIQAKIAGVLPHVTVEHRHLRQVMQRDRSQPTDVFVGGNDCNLLFYLITQSYWRFQNVLQTFGWHNCPVVPLFTGLQGESDCW